MNVVERLEELESDTDSYYDAETCELARKKIKELEGKIVQLTTALNRVERDEYMIKYVYNLACQGVMKDHRERLYPDKFEIDKSNWFRLGNAMMDVWPDILVNSNDVNGKQ